MLVSVYAVSWQAWMQQWMEQYSLITTLSPAVSSQGIWYKLYKTLASSPGVKICLSSTLNLVKCLSLTTVCRRYKARKTLPCIVEWKSRRLSAHGNSDFCMYSIAAFNFVIYMLIWLCCKFVSNISWDTYRGIPYGRLYNEEHRIKFNTLFNAHNKLRLERARNQGIFSDIAGLGATSILDRSTYMNRQYPSRWLVLGVGTGMVQHQQQLSSISVQFMKSYMSYGVQY